MDHSLVKPISDCFVKPKYEVEASQQPYHLAPLELVMLSFHYIQNGLLFTKPSNPNEPFSIHEFLNSLKESLAHTLVHFYPLAGQLVIQFNEEHHNCTVFVDCNKGPGARFSHAAALDITVSDILSPADIPSVVGSFFDYNDEAVNYNGYRKPLLSVQVTELLDGVFIAGSINHVVVDGTSYWHFWNVWSEIHRAKGDSICESRLPVHSHWYPDACALPIPLPFSHEDQFIQRYVAPVLREKIFHFSAESIANLKAKANSETHGSTADAASATADRTISSFQALTALVWRSIARANSLSYDQVIYNHMFANNRHRINPALPQNYFGTCIQSIPVKKTTVGELLENNLGWSASLLHQSVVNLTDKVIRDFVKGWLESPYCYHHTDLHDYNSIAMEHSPRFDVYGNEFGLGKPVAVRGGSGNKAVGVVNAYPGYEGEGSVDLEICLPPDSMNALELDQEFMTYVSSSN